MDDDRLRKVTIANVVFKRGHGRPRIEVAEFLTEVDDHEQVIAIDPSSRLEISTAYVTERRRLRSDDGRDQILHDLGYRRVTHWDHSARGGCSTFIKLEFEE